MVIKNLPNSHLSPFDVPGGDKPPSKMGVLINSDRKTCSVVVPDEVEILKKKIDDNIDFGQLGWENTTYRRLWSWLIHHWE